MPQPQPTTWLIGAAAGCDIQIASSYVSARHCRLTFHADHWTLEDLGSTNGCFVNGLRISGALAVSPADRVTLGTTVPLPWPAAPTLPGDEAVIPLPTARRPLVIGRTEGHVRLPHDPLVSGRHAEIVREGAARPHRWLLRDLGSSNGTFVRCARTVLRPESLIMLGGRRFRFQPAGAGAVESAPAGTLTVDVAAVRVGGWPHLVEMGQVAEGLELVLAGHDLTIGRLGHGNAVEIDDPLLADRHARVIRDPAGRWVLEAMPSLNGVWAQVAAVQLASVCRFQIGEQRFLFVVDECRIRDP